MTAGGRRTAGAERDHSTRSRMGLPPPGAGIISSPRWIPLVAPGRRARGFDRGGPSRRVGDAATRFEPRPLRARPTGPPPRRSVVRARRRHAPRRIGVDPRADGTPPRYGRRLGAARLRAGASGDARRPGSRRRGGRALPSGAPGGPPIASGADRARHPDSMIGAREYGTSGPLVVVLHRGPGAPGSAGPLARGLADTFRVLEPLQRASGERPLTVARHVADLRELLSRRGGRPALVGHSWGAMLALVYAAAYPSDVAALALVGCGTFDRKARDRLIATREERMDDALRRDLARLAEEIPDPDATLQATANLLLPVDSYEPLATELELDACDARAHP